MINVNGQVFMRGQVWWCDGDTTKDGFVQTKRRPHVVVSNNFGNKYSSIVTVVPCTSEEKKDLATHVQLYFNGMTNTVLCEQIRTMNKSDLTKYMITLDDEAMERIDEAIKVTLGLSNVGMPKEPFAEEVTSSVEVPEAKPEPKPEPKPKPTKPQTSGKHHWWSIEEKQEYVEYYTAHGKTKTAEKYKTGQNTKLYYERFLKSLQGYKRNK